MKLFVTIFEESCAAAIDAIRALSDDHDGVEIRAERLPDVDLTALRAATAKPLVLTYRTTGAEAAPAPPVHAAIEAGFDFVDIEWREGVDIEVPERTILSFHDFDGLPEVDDLADMMWAMGCAHTKIAATPQSFDDNMRLLNLLSKADGRQTTVIGMGERGLYSRILAPFRGSALSFVAARTAAAPGQLTLDHALEIFGPRRERLHAKKVFAVVGDPVGHSLSPSIHNPLFRRKRVAAAYTIACVARFSEITDAFLAGEPCGLSVTSPFKDDAFAFAQACNADLGANALRAKAVNTLVNTARGLVADNTDVDGFAALLPAQASHAAVIGAGGTARAALVALEDAGIPATVFNRTAAKGDRSLDDLSSFDGDLIINTLPSGVSLELPPCRFYIEAAYGGSARDVRAQQRAGGLDLLHAQAVRQHELFMKVFDEQ